MANPPPEASTRPCLTLAYVRPAWFDRLVLPVRRRKRPRVRWCSNVAHVRLAAVGFRLMETPEGWRLAWWHPERHRANRLHPFSGAGTWCEAVAALSALRACEARPVYPPLMMEAHR